MFARLAIRFYLKTNLFFCLLFTHFKPESLTIHNITNKILLHKMYNGGELNVPSKRKPRSGVDV